MAIQYPSTVVEGAVFCVFFTTVGGELVLEEFLELAGEVVVFLAVLLLFPSLTGVTVSSLKGKARLIPVEAALFFL